jgi:hypothetical protein
MLRYSDLGLAAYEPGAPVSWTDDSVVRGQEYEYQVRSYADDTGTKKISSNVSIALTGGWAMAQPGLAFGSVTYSLDGTGSLYIGAELALVFTHETKGLGYQYRLVEKADPVEDSHPLNADPGGIVYPPVALSHGELSAYTVRYDLTGKTSPSHRGRGYYSYEVQVSYNDFPVETVYTLGSRLITENTEPIEIQGFSVEDGYADRFILRWDREDNRQYVIKSAAAAEGPWSDVAQYPVGGGAASNFAHPVTGQANGLTRYFSIQAKNAAGLPGDTYYSPAVQTLGRAQISLGEASYDRVDLLFDPVQRADQFTLSYQYEGGGSFTKNFSPSELSLNDLGQYVYSLRPDNSNQAAWAGKNLTLTLKARNTARAAETSSDPLPGARIFGPAGMTVQAARHESVDTIRLTWNEVAGAAGYYVIRRQFTPDDSQPVAAGDIRYYVDALNLAVKGKEIVDTTMGPMDTSDVNLPVALGAVVTRTGTSITLEDPVLSDTGHHNNEQAKNFGIAFTNRYANEQNEIAWGYPYRYLVVPVLSEAHYPVVNFAMGTWTLEGASLSGIGAFEATGGTLGFVHDVAASKGTGHGAGSDSNDRVTVSWTPPAGAPAGVLYNVYRKKQSGGGWDKINGAAFAATAFDDTSALPGTVYEYLAALQDTGKGLIADPAGYGRFLAKNQESRVPTVSGQEEARIAGFILPQPTILSASRTANSDAGGYYEIVKWDAAGVDFGSGKKNRGIAGYVIEVRDQSHDRNWQIIKKVTLSGDPANFTEKLYNTNGLLNVLRDYRHYFRVRSYADDEFYSLPPDDLPLDGSQSDYIKWGARPITATEFAGLGSLAIGAALKGVSYGAATLSGDKTTDIDLNGKTPFFLTLAGTLRVTTNKAFLGSTNITKYGNNNTLTFSFNAGDVPFVYNGSVTINSLTSSGGTYSVTFDGTTVSVDRKYILKPFTFGGTTGQSCDSMYVWNETAGWQ